MNVWVGIIDKHIIVTVTVSLETEFIRAISNISQRNSLPNVNVLIQHDGATLHYDAMVD